MKYLKKYGIYIVMLLFSVLAELYLDEKNALRVQAVILLMAVAYCLIRLQLRRKKYRFCPQCEFRTHIDWITKNLDASDEPVRIGTTWFFGGTFTRKRAIIRCPRCGWKMDLSE